ncbi:MAG: helix-turn-helix domain-containing protein, partial [Ktedonobacteraceae bacterium]
VRPDPVTFPALVRVGELAAQGWTDRAIADELEGYISRTARFGERLLTKDTIAAIRRSWFPREFAPGSGHGTIDTPSGELVEGKHQAAWPYELWQRMVEVKASQYTRPRKDAQRHPHDFSRIIVCATCRRQLRVTFGNNNKNILPYYRDTSVERKLPCRTAEAGNLSVRSSFVVQQFGDILRSVELPIAWRDAIAERCRTEGSAEVHENERLRLRRSELEGEQKRLSNLYAKGYITEHELDEKMEHVRSELFALPLPVSHSPEYLTREAIVAGETLERMADYWNEAMPEERRDIVWSLLNAEGLIYDLERRIIVGLQPRVAVLPVLALGLEATSMWERREDSLWLLEEYLPPPLERDKPRLPPQPPALTPAQQEQAIMLIRQGMSLRKVADILETSHESIRRLVKHEGIVLQSSGPKLTPEQLREAYALLQADVPYRKVAAQFGVSDMALWRLAQRDQVMVRSKGEKLTPTQRKLTEEQRQEMCRLVETGVPLRQVAKQFGVNRSTLRRMIRKGSGEAK